MCILSLSNQATSTIIDSELVAALGNVNREGKSDASFAAIKRN